MMDNVFCTVLSKLRLYQAIALFCSLHEVLGHFTLHTLCVDDETYQLLDKMNWENIKLTHIDEIKDDTLVELKATRKLNEYCWTLKPLYLEYLFDQYPQIRRITYLDSDLFFFGDPTSIFTTQPDSPVLLSKGDVRVPSLDDHGTQIIQSILGRYNSGFISFRRYYPGLKCLRWWKEKCLECCASMPGGGKFGDQKYLDEIPKLFKEAAEIKTPGVNVGHWNSNYYNFSLYQGTVFADLNPLICYHFSGFRILKGDRIVLIHEADKINHPFFYEIYRNILQNVISSISIVDPQFDGRSTNEDLGLLPHSYLQL